MHCVALAVRVDTVAYVPLESPYLFSLQRLPTERIFLMRLQRLLGVVVFVCKANTGTHATTPTSTVYKIQFETVQRECADGAIPPVAPCGAE